MDTASASSSVVQAEVSNDHSTDTLVTACLRAARNLGYVGTYQQGNNTMKEICESIETLSSKLTITQRALLGTAVLYYMRNSVKIQARREWGSQIKEIDNSSQLSKLLITCLIWIVSFDEPVGVSQCGNVDWSNFMDVEIPEWKSKHILRSNSTGIQASNNFYFDLIRRTAIKWVKEIAFYFKRKLRTRDKSFYNTEWSQTKDAEPGEGITSVLSQIGRHELEQCYEALDSLSSRVPHAWLSALAIVVLHFLKRSADCVGTKSRSKYVGDLLQTCLAWIQPIDEDLAEVSTFANTILPGSTVGWKQPKNSFKKIWHRTHTSEEMSNPWAFELEITGGTILTHATTCTNLIQMLKDAADGGYNKRGAIKVKGRQSCQNYTGANLVWTGVKLTKPQREAIPESCSGKNFLLNSPERYGSVCLQFPLECVLEGGNFAHILSTRLYRFEYSQSILLSPSNQVVLRHVGKCENDKPSLNFGPMNQPISLLGHKWNIALSETKKSWTHPELVFHTDELSISLEKCKISFIEHAKCVGQKRCEDCGFSPANGRKMFNYLLKHTESQSRRLQDLFDIQDTDDFNVEITPTQVEASAPKKARFDDPT